MVTLAKFSEISQVRKALSIFNSVAMYEDSQIVVSKGEYILTEFSFLSEQYNE